MPLNVGEQGSAVLTLIGEVLLISSGEVLTGEVLTGGPARRSSRAGRGDTKGVPESSALNQLGGRGQCDIDRER